MLKTYSHKFIASILAFVVVLTCTLFLANRIVFADSCKKIYGGGKDCDHDLRITKEVSKDQDKSDEDKEYFDSIELDSSEKNKVITFRIEVENRGDVDEDDLKVIDELPEEIFEVLYGEDLEYEIEELDNSEGNDDDKEDTGKRTFYLHVRVKSSAFKAGVVKCVENVAILEQDGEEIDDDDADVCFGKKVTQLPKTGNEDVIVMTFLGFGMILVGVGVKRFIV